MSLYVVSCICVPFIFLQSRHHLECSGLDIDQCLQIALCKQQGACGCPCPWTGTSRSCSPPTEEMRGSGADRSLSTLSSSSATTPCAPFSSLPLHRGRFSCLVLSALSPRDSLIPPSRLTSWQLDTVPRTSLPKKAPSLSPRTNMAGGDTLEVL